MKPWHHFVALKPELKSGELTLAEFAADLHEVALARGKRAVYENPEQFFALTYPTHALRELVKDVASRLAGRSDKAVRQLELTYGGGKTHTLITLYHLFRNPVGLPNMPAVREFREHVGGALPQAFVATLCFDKIDVERGIEDVKAPNGETRTLRHPWSVLAYQLAGSDGLRAIHADGEDAERETPPAEPLLAKLLAIPAERGLSTLVLIDEVLMYAREKVGLDAKWQPRIVDFFQHLTAAVGKVDQAAMVASLLATDPAKQDDLGRRVRDELFAVVRRQREEGVQPVAQRDVAEVLRRRFFQRDSLQDEDAYRSHVIGVVRELATLDETTAKDRPRQETRFLESFPFHPDLTDVFYSKWTQLAAFQRTRGILRTLATALRAAEEWDASPLVGPAALLASPGDPGVSEAVKDLANVVDTGSEGRPTDWARLLESELLKARAIQDDFPALQANRAVEQAVIATFLHSQPIGGKASTPDLQRMAGTAADGIQLAKALRRWRDASWFLDDEDARGIGPDDLPKSWRLGNRPNLKQMHDEACRDRVTKDAVDDALEKAVRKAKSALDGGAAATGAKVHLLPKGPADVRDDGDFRFVILGPEGTSESGRPIGAAKRYLNETTRPDRPRVHRNAVVLAVPSRDGLDVMRGSARTLLGWEDVAAQLQGQDVDPLRAELLRRELRAAQARLPQAIRQGYAVVVTVNENGDVHAFRLAAAAGPLFVEIKNDERSRIKETAVDAEALLPEGPYDLWRDDEDARLVKDIANAFARDPRLPKMLNGRVVLDTVLQGVERGLFVARLARPDGSGRTWWREPVAAEAHNDPTLEVVLPHKAVLAELPSQLLAPDALPALWKDQCLTLGDAKRYFSGEHGVTITHAGWEEWQAIPRCEDAMLEAALTQAVEKGTVWLVNGPTSCWHEAVPVGSLDENAQLRPPPQPLTPQELTPKALPGAWENGETNGVALVRALSRERGEAVPWRLVRNGMREAVRSRWLETVGGIGVVDDFDQAGQWRLKVPAGTAPAPAPAPEPQVSNLELDASELQNLAEEVPKLLRIAAGYGLSFHVGVALSDDAPESVRRQVAEVLKDARHNS